jgi:hypothetical protein
MHCAFKTLGALTFEWPVGPYIISLHSRTYRCLDTERAVMALLWYFIDSCLAFALANV